MAMARLIVALAALSFLVGAILPAQAAKGCRESCDSNGNNCQQACQ